MPNFKKCVFVEDLLVVTLYSCLTTVFVLIPPFNETFLRILLSLPLFFIIPGYAFIAALFPGKKELSGMERFTLSFAFSFVLTVFDGFLISLLPWGYRPASIVISILGVTTFFSIIAIFTRKLLEESDQFSFSIKEFIQSIKSGEINENSKTLEETPDFEKKMSFYRFISKVKAKGLKYQHCAGIKKQLMHSENIKVLVIALISSIIISIEMLAYAKMTQEKDAFIVLYLLGITTFFSIIAIITIKCLNESDQFSFSVKEFMQLIKSESINENSKTLEETPDFGKKRSLHRFISKVKAKFLEFRPEAEIEKLPLPPDIEKGLIIGLVISIILVSGIQVYAKVTQEKEIFTALYILGPDGKAEGYPTESLIDVPLNVTVEIENHELKDVNYVLQMKADEEVIEELNISVKDGGTWNKNMTYLRQKFKTGRSKLEFALFKDKPDYFPYRSVHLYIENNNTLVHVDKQKYTEIPVIENGEMESSTGWEFTSNTDKITGSYVNGSGVDSSFAYRIVNSYEGNLSGFPEYGEISQNIKSKEDTMVVLSAHVKGDSNSSSQGANAQVKQITVNGETIWTEGISEDEDWQHLRVPISLQAGSNNLKFGLKQISGEFRPVEVLWDGISLKPLTDTTYVSQNGIAETTPPSSSVLNLSARTKSATFTVSWNGTDDASGIAYYSIDSSTDGINWTNWIPETTDKSSVFTGENEKTYYFRSKAVDNAGNEEHKHPKADTQTKIYTGTLKYTLDIFPNPCKNATTFTVTYPLPLQAVVCLVTLDGVTPDGVTPDGGFGPESVELKSTDGVSWTGSYIVKSGKHFNVEALCTDINGNTASTFDELTVDNSLPDLLIEINPKTIDTGDLEIKVTPSTALTSAPSVSISANETVDVTYLSYSDGTYLYKAKINPINEGEHTVSITGKSMDSGEIKGSSKFVVDHPG